jgi:hypothetical protein
MELEQLSAAIDARVLSPRGGGKGEIYRVYASDKMSALLEHAGPGTLLVTTLANTQLARMAELMDCTALCLAETAGADGDLLEAAERSETVLLVCPFDLFETCGRLHRRLYGDNLRRR